MAKRAFKLHKTNSKPKCSVISIFVVLWLVTMTGGMIFMFRSEIMNTLEEFEGKGGLQSITRKVAIPEIVESVSDPELARPDIDLVAEIDHIAPKKDDPSPSHLAVDNDAIDHSSTDIPEPPVVIASAPVAKKSPIPQSRKQITDLVNFEKCTTPPPIKKSGKMWLMPIKEQRQYLQDIHCNESSPSPAAADRFISAAMKSFADPVAVNAPSKWDVPADMQKKIRNSKPGDTVKYRIAGKDVDLPYGYPEESIFVLTASYRDPEVAYTIARAYARAAHPERIFFGIHAQNAAGDEEQERDPIGGLPFTGVECPSHPVCSRLHQIHVSRAHWSRSEGPTVARAIAEQFYNNETYTMGIDSHCHFLRGWDNVGIDMFRRIGNDHAIISTYPPGYTSRVPKGDGSEDYDVNPTPKTQTSICRTRRVNFHTTVSFKHDFSSMERPKNGPIRTAFFAAGFSFSRGHRILRVPYDMHTPYIFDGEEISMGARAWTWGYDLYQPDRDIITHLYIAAHSGVRPVFWESPYWSIQWPTQFGALLRLQKQLRVFNKLQGSEGILAGKLDMEEFDIYDTGPRRPAEQFWKWAHIDLQNNWGENCQQPGHPEIKGRQYCYSESLCPLYNREGGMDYVPWKEGTEDLFPPMVRTDKYPPMH